MELSYRLTKAWRRNFLTFFKTWRLNVVPPFLEPLLYLLALGFGLGSFIDNIQGISYVKFIAPALVSISVMNASFFECTYTSFVRMYYLKTFDAMIATPISIEDVIAGELLWGATRSTIYATFMLPVLILFGVVELPFSLLIIPFAFLSGLLFASIAMCFTAITPNIDNLNYPMFLFITPMFLFSGTFFPLSLLPQTVQYVALAILPLAHVVIVNRTITLSAIGMTTFFSVIWILIATSIFFFLSIKLMKNRVII
ncbi:MAG: ABC-2 type transporter [Candidatus Methanofastidiosum methylothiophilum]|uniref:ABC-2 type transporter n=1 Tax=Candidatus Methanofastidiosum methylothiophilum TaxID=1705564 RepID=A0A150IPT9_9EURY|nr:MAG: ABC-2 type transporter [Candidatus Methanofastidiosum methylthiophilus]